MSDWRQRVLGEWASRLIAQSRRADSIVSGLGADQLVRPPAPGKWGVAHCLDHLAITLREYRPRLESAIAQGEAHPSAELPEYHPGGLARWLIRMVGPGGRSVPAPRIFRPSEVASADAPARFAGAQAELLELLRRADAVDLQRWKLRSPASFLLRFRIGEAFEILVRHNDRHLDQAERARAVVTGGASSIARSSRSRGEAVEDR